MKKLIDESEFLKAIASECDYQVESCDDCRNKCELYQIIYYQSDIVRCNNCEHCYFASNRIPSEQNYACGKHGFDVAPDWFCADGERK